jgi:glycosyltransferase involved in cell wall biosynthesis
MSEGLPMALLEGCASGIRVIASDIPPHRSVQQIFPKQVQIFDCEDADSVREAFDRVPRNVTEPRLEPEASALEMISARRMAARYQEFYRGVLQSAGRTIAGF